MTIGVENEICAGAILGGTPQDRSYHGEDTSVEIGDRNQLREYCTIHLATEHGARVSGRPMTSIGDDNLVMGGTHIAHDCHFGSRIILGNNSLVAGHVRIEDDAIISGGTGIHHWCTIGRLAFVGALARVAMDVPPFLIVEGRPGRVRGFNTVGISRAGIDGARLEALREAYKILFHTSETREAALQAIESSNLMTDEVRSLVTSLRRSDQGYKGRYREGLSRGKTFDERARGGEESATSEVF